MAQIHLISLNSRDSWDIKQRFAYSISYLLSLKYLYWDMDMWDRNISFLLYLDINEIQDEGSSILSLISYHWKPYIGTDMWVRYISFLRFFLERFIRRRFVNSISYLWNLYIGTWICGNLCRQDMTQAGAEPRIFSGGGRGMDAPVPSLAIVNV